jgi:UDP-glucose 4-epimerase
MKNILVTGGAGFIGTNLIKRLKKEGYNITSIDSYISGKVTNHVEGVNYVKLNTKDFNKNNSLYYANFDVVFHLGEYSRIVSSFDDINEVWFSNSLGTFNVIEYCKKNKIKMIYAGSSTKFAKEGIDHSPYSFTKSKSAELVKNYNKWFDLDYSICYFYNVFGEGYDSSPVNGYESVISVFEKQYKNGQPLTICGDGQQSRSFTYVGDIVDGLIKSWEYSKNGEFQLNNENTYTILEIAKMFSDNITFIPTRKGDRLTSTITNNNSREILNWETTKNVDEWIKEIKK